MPYKEAKKYFTEDGEEIKDNKYAVGCAIGCFIYIVIMCFLLACVVTKYLIKLLTM